MCVTCLQTGSVHYSRVWYYAMSAARSLEWISLLVVCARIALCHNFLESFRQELVQLQESRDFDVVYSELNSDFCTRTCVVCIAGVCTY